MCKQLIMVAVAMENKIKILSLLHDSVESVKTIK